jgi:hypothetical protein
MKQVVLGRRLRTQDRAGALIPRSGMNGLIYRRSRVAAIRRTNDIPSPSLEFRLGKPFLRDTDFWYCISLDHCCINTLNKGTECLPSACRNDTLSLRSRMGIGEKEPLFKQ